MVYMTLDNGLVAYLFQNNIEMSLIWKIMNLRYHVISMVDQSSWPVRVQEITLSFYCKIWVKYVNSISESKFYPNWTDKWLYKLEYFQLQQMI